MRISQNFLTLNLKSFLPITNKLPNLHLNFTHQLHVSKSSLLQSNLVGRKDPIAFATALTFSSKIKSFVLGKQIHAQIIKLGFYDSIFLQNSLIVMYSKCVVLSYGLKLFGEMSERNLVSWTSLISGAIQNGEFELGLEMYLDMMRTGLRPNEFALGSVLRACTSLEAVKFGLSIHCVALKFGIEKNLFVGCSILHMYAKCGDIEVAEQVFECMGDLDVGCWNAMIGGYALNGHGFEAIKLVSLMHHRGTIMDQFTFMNALKGCSILGDLTFGRQIHGLIIRSEVEFNPSGINSLMDMYFKMGGKDYALKLFAKMEEKDVISWNTVFSGFSQGENAREVTNFFSKMLSTGLKPNHVTFSITFRLCAEVLDLVLGLQFYCHAFHLGFFDDALVASSLINMFSRCGVLEMARFLFDSVPAKNVITWNEMISGYNLNCCDMEALKLFCNLWELGTEVNEFTFSSILGACSRTEHQQIGKQIHGAIIKSGFGFHGFVCGSLINAYARFGLVEESFKVFNGIARLDLASWGAMVSAFVHQGCSYEALKLLNQLKEAGEKPDEFILGSVLNCCANISAYHQTKSIHSHVIKTGFEKHVCVASAVVDAYAKCGDIESSRMTFDQSSRYDDSVLFNAMIMAYAQHGLIMKAIEIFEKMKWSNLQPSHATFVSVITACSHLGLVDQGRWFFESIRLDYGMEPSAENFGCLVDLFSRNGFLEEAKHVVEVIPFPPWPAIWRSLLSGCRIHGHIELGEWAAKRLLQLVPENDAAYVLLSKFYSEEGRWEDAAKVLCDKVLFGGAYEVKSWENCQEVASVGSQNDAAYVLLSKVYSEEGRWEDAAKVRRRMKERGVRKEPRYSFLDTKSLQVLCDKVLFGGAYEVKDSLNCMFQIDMGTGQDWNMELVKTGRRYVSRTQEVSKNCRLLCK
ncbi:hypothetical protein HHK36_033434 [Tetracentron sinense]|uniref:Pentatricopeptide repeat-containing protein n=1 Tax=Tetracentron sinense TaxID=13715 RepID=A0A834Y5Z6_TETSI|nr:hypothetical protein HHK36_033434 [Tetracentron sinense]